VEGVEERLRVGQALDAERRRRRHDDALDAVGPRERRPRRGIVRARVERRGGLAGQLELPTAPLPP
jgi:hypothetical protein